MHLRSTVRATLAALCTLGGAIAIAALAAAPAGAASTGAALVLPTHDPFYRYTRPLARVKPGTVLRTRKVKVPEFSDPTSATQVLYRTTTELGRPAVTVATVLRPDVKLSKGLISYQTAYDSLGPKCDPSYAFRGGDTADNGSGNDLEAKIIETYLTAGYTVVVPDYEGEQFDWTAGQQAGYATLDGIRAAEHVLKLAQRTTPVGMVGYSGGSIATQFAAELAPRYAPRLDLVGAASGGVPVDFAHNLRYINGTKGWSGVIPAALVGLARGFDIDVNPYLSAYGRKLAHQVRNACINSFEGAYPGLTYQKLLKHRYRDLFKIRPLAKIIDHLIMGRSGTPRIPMMFGVGNADGTGDGIMIAKDVEALAHEYCERHVNVQFTEYPGMTHEEAAIPFEGAAYTYLTARLAGVPAVSGCASIGRGNSLKPVPVPPAQRHKR